MPKYYVYDKDSGQVIHIHERYDVASGTTLPCTREEVFAVLDEELDRNKLDMLESDFEPKAGTGPLRVDTNAQEVVSSK
jgi:hypothetical protein